MYDELFDVLFEEYLNDTDILNEDAGGARGKYIQVQKEKLKKLEEKKKKIEALNNHATGSNKDSYGYQLFNIKDEIKRIQKDINWFDDLSNHSSHNPDKKNNFKQTYHDQSDGGRSVHGNINRRAEER